MDCGKNSTGFSCGEKFELKFKKVVKSLGATAVNFLYGNGTQSGKASHAVAAVIRGPENTTFIVFRGYALRSLGPAIPCLMFQFRSTTRPLQAGPCRRSHCQSA